MSMNRHFVLKKEEVDPQWRVFDASGRVLGRLATEVADILRGKDKAYFTPHTDCGDYVVIVNADKIVLTGNKWDDKTYIRVSGYMSGKKETAAKDMCREEMVMLAVRRMLPKNRLSRQVIKKLKVYKGAEHPHMAQVK